MSPPARIFFVNRFYWPDEPATGQLLTDLAASLAAAGLRITILTSHPGGSSVPLRETRRDVEIIRVRGSRLGRKNLAARVLDFATFLLGARRALARLAVPGDTVVALTDPPLLGAVLAGLARQKNLRLIHWVQDVFPEVAMNAGHRLAACTRGWRDRAWLGAAGCIVLGTDMAALVRKRGVPESQIHIIPNWAPVGLAPLPHHAADGLRERWGLQGKLVVVYSGNLGRVHDFSAIVPLAISLRDDTDIAFVFIGDGARRAALEADVRAHGLTSVHFHPAQPREQLAETLALGDVHLVTLRAGCEELVFPSKLYGIAAVGRPVIFIGPRMCEVARLIEERGFGLAFGHAEIGSLADALRALRDDPQRRAALGAAAAEFSLRAGRLSHASASWQSLLLGKPLARHPAVSPSSAHPHDDRS
jgi:colanic acid biosynthesis glycosyl transferase WcaI